MESMELFSPAFFAALLSIILIDLALAGDNAIVIGLAARKVPKHMQKKVLFWGSIAAVAVRAICTMFVVWLLKIPGFLLAGGLVLIYIAWKLVQPSDESAHEIKMGSDVSLRSAIQTIVIADTAMGIENVLAIGGVAHGSFLLVVIGLLISVPIIMFGSQIVVKMVEKYPSIIWMGGAILAYTAVNMMFNEGFMADWVKPFAWVEWVVTAVVVAAIVVPVLLRKPTPVVKD
jgi:YjbE family integral membrane protein